jgi:hypothetical protein
MIWRAYECGTERQRARWPRDWVALLRSPLNSRSSVAADNPPRNATQVIGQFALCRSNPFSTRATLSYVTGAPYDKRFYVRTRALELTLS